MRAPIPQHADSVKGVDVCIRFYSLHLPLHLCTLSCCVYSELGGLTLLALGIWASADGGSFLQTLGTVSTLQAVQFINVGFFCVAVGVVLALLGLLGFWAAHRESKCLLLMFFSIVLIIFITEVAAAVVALAYSSFAEGILRAWATPALKERYGAEPVVTKIWNTTMTELKCCGFTNHTDFEDSRFTRENNGSLPVDCCLGKGTYCSPQRARKDNVEGCFEELLELVQTNADVVGGVAAGIGAMEVAAMVVSIYLYCYLDNRDTIKA
ncbi:unnamed protein product [Boreogadus saida]